MSGQSSIRLAAAVCLVATTSASLADAPGGALDFISANAAPPAPAEGAAPASRVEAKPAAAGIVQGNVHALQRGNAGNITRQTGSVTTGCLKPELLAILNRASSHFGSEVVVTSGFRRGRGFHARCMAADVQIAGVGSGVLARYFRGQPGVGGVGTYGHTRSVHVDVADRKYSWHGRSRRTRVADASCPCCGGAPHGARSAFACERSVIAAGAIRLGGQRG